jgi:hypothetical protein
MKQARPIRQSQRRRLIADVVLRITSGELGAPDGRAALKRIKQGRLLSRAKSPLRPA